MWNLCGDISVEGIAKGPPESLSERPCGGALKSSLCRVPRKVSVKDSVEGLCGQSCGVSEVGPNEVY